jgi:hypothetical protein
VIGRDVLDLVEAHGIIRNAADFPAVPNSRIRETGADPAGFYVADDGTLIGEPQAPVILAPWLDADPIAVLAFLASPAAQPWLPTFRELKAARATAVAAKRQAADIQRSSAAAIAERRRASIEQASYEQQLRSHQIRDDIQRSRARL